MAAEISARDKLIAFLESGGSVKRDELETRTCEIFSHCAEQLGRNVDEVMADLEESHPLRERVQAAGIDPDQYATFVSGISKLCGKVVSVASSKVMMGEIETFGRDEPRSLIGIPEDIQPIVETFFSSGKIPEGLPDKQWLPLARAALGLDSLAFLDALVKQRVDPFPEDHEGVVALYEMILNLGDASLPVGEYNALQGLRRKCEASLVAHWMAGNEPEEGLAAEIQSFTCPTSAPIPMIVTWLNICSNATIVMWNDQLPRSIEEGIPIYDLILDRFDDANLVSNCKLNRLRSNIETKFTDHWYQLSGEVPPEHERFLPHIKFCNISHFKDRETIMKILLRCPGIHYHHINKEFFHRLIPRTEAKTIALWRQIHEAYPHGTTLSSQPSINFLKLMTGIGLMVNAEGHINFPEGVEEFPESITTFAVNKANFEEALTKIESCPNIDTLFCTNITQDQLKRLLKKIPKLRNIFADNCPFTEIPPEISVKLDGCSLENCPNITHIELPQAGHIKLKNCPKLKEASCPKAMDIRVLRCSKLELLECEKATSVVCHGSDLLPVLYLPNANYVSFVSDYSPLTELVCPRANFLKCRSPSITTVIAPQAEFVDCQDCPDLKRMVCPQTAKITSHGSPPFSHLEA